MVDDRPIYLKLHLPLTRCCTFNVAKDPTIYLRNNILLEGMVCNESSMCPLFSVKGGYCDAMSSLCVPMFKLREDVEIVGLIFTFSYDQPYCNITYLFGYFF
jgi:hypothetical protein